MQIKLSKQGIFKESSNSLTNCKIGFILKKNLGGKEYEKENGTNTVCSDDNWIVGRVRIKI